VTPAYVKALVFDIDGTLYRQPPLRRAILLRLLAMMAVRPAHGWRTVRVLREYRRAQETLRLAAAETDIAEAQISLTCDRTHVDRRSVVDCVRRWMDEEPLALLPRYVQPGLLEFLRACKARGLCLAALSDYPAQAKLEALGVADLFDVVLAAQDPDIDVFKPNPRGLLVALERLGSTPSETLYVGDRIDVDVPTAEAAGVGCVIVSRRHTARDPAGPLYVASYAELHDLLWR
jgi:phosphoglycolate phosphatase/putative hydrolase of the HAD superfamily